MASDKNEEYNWKTSQGAWTTSLILQAVTRNRMSEQKNLSCFQWKLRYGNGIPKVKPLDYGSEFRDITVITILFSYHKEKEIIANIIPKGSRYHLSTI